MLFCAVAIPGFLVSLTTQNSATLTSTWRRRSENSGEEGVDLDSDAGGQKELGLIGVWSCALRAKEGKRQWGENSKQELRIPVGRWAHLTGGCQLWVNDSPEPPTAPDSVKAKVHWELRKRRFSYLIHSLSLSIYVTSHRPLPLAPGASMPGAPCWLITLGLWVQVCVWQGFHAWGKSGFGSDGIPAGPDSKSLSAWDFSGTSDNCATILFSIFWALTSEQGLKFESHLFLCSCPCACELPGDLVKTQLLIQ